MPTESKERTSKKIALIVEDDVVLVKAYRMKLEKEGAEIWVAVDGNKAIAYLEQDPPAIVVLDLMLPGVSGFEVLEAIRKNERWKKVPVLVLSNLGQPKDIERCKTLGIQDYLVKANVRINDVVAKIKEYL